MSPSVPDRSILDHPVVRAVPAGILPGGARVLVAVSGGADSVALTHVLHALAPARGWELRLAHVNHRLRGEDSDADESFVRRLAGSLRLACDVAAVEVSVHAARNRQSPETAARNLRYAELRRMLRSWSGDFIAVGHTRDDQAETVLMRLLRGSGLTGLAAMRLRRADVVRPLLGASRESIIDLLQAHHIPYRLDRSNRDLLHTRNRVRHELLPILERNAAGASGRLAATASILQPDADYIRAEAEAALAEIAAPESMAVSLAGWLSLHPSLRRTLLRLLAERHGGSPSELSGDQTMGLEEALLRTRSTPQAIEVGTAYTVWTDGGRFSFSAPARNLERRDDIALPFPGEIPTPAGTLIARPLESGGQDALGRLLAVIGPWRALFDADQIASLRLRTRRAGDRISPLGVPGRKKVQDVMVDLKVPRSLREAWPLIADGDEILWIPGLARSEIGRITPTTSNVIELSFRPISTLHRARIPRHFR